MNSSLLFDQHISLYHSYLEGKFNTSNCSNTSFEEWENFIKLYATQILINNNLFNLSNLNFLLDSENTQRYCYELGDTPKFYILETWNQHDLNSSYGREIFLIQNNEINHA